MDRYWDMIPLYKEYDKTVFHLPTITRLDTLHGKMEYYETITQIWKHYDHNMEGNVLLALVETLEQMSKTIYEFYRVLQDLLRENIDNYLYHVPKRDVLGGLAVLKACSLELVPPEYYAQEGLNLLRSGGKVIDGREDIYVKMGLDIWKALTEKWGIEDEC